MIKATLTRKAVNAMFSNRTEDGRNNIAGIKVAELRKGLRISQRELADRLAVVGLDIELGYLAKVFGTTIEELLGR